MTDTENVPREAWAEYKRSQIAHLRPYIVGEPLSERVSISVADLEAGSPKDGDMIARNPANHGDQWLVAADYFAANFEPVAEAPKAEREAVQETDTLEAFAQSLAFGRMRLVSYDQCWSSKQAYSVLQSLLNPRPASELLEALKIAKSELEYIATGECSYPSYAASEALDRLAKHKGPQS